mmetsp:Transcript_30323/g.76407  ORF Transcript_30323/g.76407 Transcript_30323/m.76407 type:complete len:219 (+) Transcript_30323:90-746(+)
MPDSAQSHSCMSASLPQKWRVYRPPWALCLRCCCGSLPLAIGTPARRSKALLMPSVLSCWLRHRTRGCGLSTVCHPWSNPSTLHAPLHRLTGPHRAHHGVAKGVLARDGPRRTAQRDGAAVPRQSVEVRAVEGRKALQLVQRPRLLKGVRVQRQRHGRAVDSGAAARRLLCAHGVRCAVRAQEEAGVAAGGCLQHCLAMLLPLQHGQTVVVRPQATHK